MKIGFTGTRHGMTEHQRYCLEAQLFDLCAKELHHGDCVGADVQADAIAIAMELPRIIHPPDNPRWRARCCDVPTSHATILPAKAYHVRNYEIVDACDVLIAAPRTLEEEMRSGTWMTVRYARRTKVKLIILCP